MEGTGCRSSFWAALVWLGCGNEPASGPVVCEGSTLDPAAECGEGYCVNGDVCEPIFDACGESEVPILGGGCRHVGLPEDCWDGWVNDGEDGCEPIMAEDCPTGTMQVIGQAECQPVGLPQDCWPGWVNDGDGGCEPILPSGSCPDGTMEIIGQATCQPIGDCSAPPAAEPGAIFVDATYAGPDPSDGTAARPFTLVQDAIDAAPTGGQVVLPDEYVEDVSIAKALRLEGQCAALVTIRGVGGLPYAVRILGTGRFRTHPTSPSAAVCSYATGTMACSSVGQPQPWSRSSCATRWVAGLSASAWRWRMGPR